MADKTAAAEPAPHDLDQVPAQLDPGPVEAMPVVTSPACCPICGRFTLIGVTESGTLNCYRLGYEREKAAREKAESERDEERKRADGKVAEDERKPLLDACRAALVMLRMGLPDQEHVVGMLDAVVQGDSGHRRQVGGAGYVWIGDQFQAAVSPWTNPGGKPMEAKKLGTELGRIIGIVLGGTGYSPTMAKPDEQEMADAFDAAMVVLARPERAWRGSKHAEETAVRR